MKYTNLEQWKKAVEDQRYVVKQVHGYEQFEALDGDHVVGRWNSEHGYLGEVEPTGPVGFGGAPIDPARHRSRGQLVDENGPVVTEDNVTDVKP